MRGRKRGVRGPVSRALAVTALAVLLVLAVSGAALAAPPWTDAPNSWWVATYQLTDQEIGTVADGYPDNTFRPSLDVTRAQFAKMVVDGMSLPTVNPPAPRFTDVPVSHYYYPWIEGGAAAGILSGFADGSYGPERNIIRQQANSILGSYLAQRELNIRGHIAGSSANYPSLNTWYLAEGMALVAAFADSNRLATVHAPATAYLIMRGVVQGSYSGGSMYLGPNDNLTRAQAAALIMRVKKVQFTTAMPTVDLLNPSSGPAAGGNTVVITGTNFTDVTSVKFDATSVGFTVNSTTQITVKAPAGTLGATVDVTVTTPAGTSATSAASKYTYEAPIVTALTPNAGPSAGGNQVIIAGVNLSGATAVKFGAKNATSFTVNSATKITAVAPSGVAGTTVDVTVTTPAGTSSTAGTGNDYKYGLPTITALNPKSGPTAGGTVVTITGTDFIAGATVKFGAGYPATNVTVVNSTKITCKAPAHVAGVVDVTVTTSAGTSATAGTANDYTYYGVANKLAIVTQPGGAASGHALTVAPVVQLKDAANNDVALAGVNVTASLYSGAGVLSGTLIVPTDANGRAKFTNLIITGPAGNYSLKFTSPGLTQVISAVFAMTDATGPTLNITGATANGTPMPGNMVIGYTLNVNGDPGTDYLVQFAAGSVSNEPLASAYFPLRLKWSSVGAGALEDYYDLRGVPEPYLTYLKSAANGINPFVYIKGGAGNTVRLVDGAKHNIALVDADMTIPGDFPVGTYIVEGQIYDLAANPTTVTLKLIVVDAGPTLDITGATSTPGGAMPGSVAAGFTLVTDGNPATDYLVDFAAGSESSEPLADEFFGLYLINTTVPLPTLLAYYATKPDPFKDYLNQAAVGGEPFVYIKGGAANTISLIDAAKHDLLATDGPLTVPGDYPVGTYTVQGTIEDLGGTTSVVTLKLIVTDPAATLTITGATADGADMTGTLAGGYNLLTDGDGTRNYLIQFKAGTVASEPLRSEHFGLTLIDSDVSAGDLETYYDLRGVPEPYLTYLKDAANGLEPFVYINGATVLLADGAKWAKDSVNVDMTVPGDFPVGTYTVQGVIKDLGGNETTVTLKLIVGREL